MNNKNLNNGQLQFKKSVVAVASALALLSAYSNAQPLYGDPVPPNSANNITTDADSTLYESSASVYAGPNGSAAVTATAFQTSTFI